jgi:uncharacterized protein
VKLTNEFEVPADRDTTWELLNDVPRVIPCMPGAELVEIVGENEFKVKLHVKLGPIGLQFAADVHREDVDSAAGTTTLAVKARELKGRGGATARMESTIEPRDGGVTGVVIVTDVQLQGAVASTGRGIVGEVANQMVKQFAACLSTKVVPSGAATHDGNAAVAGNGAAVSDAAPSTPEPVKPIGGLSLVVHALVDKVHRRFGKG